MSERRGWTRHEDVSAGFQNIDQPKMLSDLQQVGYLLLKLFYHQYRDINLVPHSINRGAKY